jgi:VWFA-related protein
MLRNAFIIVSLLATGGWMDAQQAPTFSSSTRLVTVAVSVTNARNGAPITGLTRDDFTVESDGVVRPVVHFDGEPGPVTIAVVLDASGSMKVNQALSPASRAATQLLDGLTPGTDRAAVFTFDREVAERHPFAPVGPTQRTALDRLMAFGSTSLYDAALATSRATALDGHARRGVVLYTDGLDTSSERTAEDVRTLSAALDVPLYLISLMPASMPERKGYVDVPMDHPLRRLAEATGGRLFAVNTDEGLMRAHQDVLTGLRQHYVLAFTPDTRPGWHALTVRTQPSHSVRARAGYVVSPRS